MSSYSSSLRCSVTPLRSVQQEQQQPDEPPRIVLAPMLRCSAPIRNNKNNINQTNLHESFSLRCSVYSAPIRYYSTNRSRSDAPLLRSEPLLLHEPFSLRCSVTPLRSVTILHEPFSLRCSVTPLRSVTTRTTTRKATRTTRRTSTNRSHSDAPLLPSDP